MQLLEKHFDIAFTAPDGIKKLRELILILAMHGKLVPQNPNDQPASELLKEIKSEKRQLKIKSHDSLQEIKPEEVPYELPKTWKWLRLPECYYGIGNKNNQIQTKDYLQTGTYPVVDQGKTFIAGYFNDQRSVLEIKKPVIVFGDHTKNVKFIDFNFVIGADGVKVLCPHEGIFPRYFYHVIQSYELTDRGYARHFKVLNEKLFPLPPLAEQQRIVKKIDDLLTRCDELEKLRNEREQKRLSVHTAALNSLLAAMESTDFSTAWHFITQYFGELYSVKENVAELRKAILQLAVMGKLVPQDPHDQPAGKLLKEIAVEKMRLVKEGKIKAIEPFPEIKAEDQAQLLPRSWEWVRLGEITIKIGSGSTPRGGKSAYEAEGIPFLRSQNIWNDGLRLNDVAFISAKTHEMMSGTKVAPMDILLNITGASLGRCALVPEDIEEANVSQHVTIIRTANPNLRRYVHLLLLSPYCQKMIWTRQVGMAREGLSKKVLEQFEIPFPPLAEQLRIVAKIDQFMTLCDEMEKKIDTATCKQTALLNAVMAQV